jgi:hypothetical protein
MRVEGDKATKKKVAGKIGRGIEVLPVPTKGIPEAKSSKVVRLVRKKTERAIPSEAGVDLPPEKGQRGKSSGSNGLRAKLRAEKIASHKAKAAKASKAAKDAASKIETLANDSDAPTTPARTLYWILQSTGWVSKTGDFAAVLEVRQKNAYMYLSERQRIKASSETIFAWLRNIERGTELQIDMMLHGDGEITFTYHGLTGPMTPGLAVGIGIPVTTKTAVEPAWMDEARVQRATARKQSMKG